MTISRTAAYAMIIMSTLLGFVIGYLAGWTR